MILKHLHPKGVPTRGIIPNHHSQWRMCSWSVKFALNKHFFQAVGCIEVIQHIRMIISRKCSCTRTWESGLRTLSTNTHTLTDKDCKTSQLNFIRIPLPRGSIRLMDLLNPWLAGEVEEVGEEKDNNITLSLSPVLKRTLSSSPRLRLLDIIYESRTLNDSEFIPPNKRCIPWNLLLKVHFSHSCCPRNELNFAKLSSCWQ